MQAPRLTLRTLLAYLDDTLPADQARALGKKVAESKEAQELIERIKRVTRRRRLTAPVATGDDDVSDPNTVAEYLSDNLKRDQVRELEETCLTSDVHLAEVAACHQILTLVLTEPVRVPPSANQRMYLLCDPPMSRPSHQPSRTLPVGGVAPRADGPELDDPDAALLLGMKRYAASESWGGRLGLVAAVGLVAASLVVAVLLALPKKPGERPEVTTAAVGGPPANDGSIPPPKPVDRKPDDKPKPDDKKPDPVKKPDDKKNDATDPKVDPKLPPDPKTPTIQPPVAGEEVVGDLLTKEAIVLSRAPNGADWTRLNPAAGAVRTGHSLVALPGYKADVVLGSQVLVHMWGNVPEQIAMPQMVMQSRVVFHTPAAGFDADLTVLTGRVYIATLKPTGAKVRLRLADEVWDVTLRNAGADVLARVQAALVGNDLFAPFWDALRTDVLVQVHTAFQPGTRTGEKARTDATLAVVSGVARVAAPQRFKTFDAVVAGQQITWDSVRGRLSDEQPIPPELFPHLDPAVPPEIDRALAKVLAEAAQSLTTPDGIRIVLKERLTKPFPSDLKAPPSPIQAIALAFPTQWAVYALASLADGPDAEDVLKDLIDTLGDAARPYARQATVMALSAWVAQSRGNTEMLVKGMVAKGWRDEDAELVARLLRGYSSLEQADPTAVDELVDYLNHPQLAVRETALGNLLAFFDPEALQVPDLRIDVARRGERAYDRFLAGWKTRAAAIKKRMMEKK